MSEHDGVTPVVDPGQAIPFRTAKAYAAAVDQARAAAAAYYAGSDLVIDDADYDALIARVAATEAAHPEWTVEDVADRDRGGRAAIGRRRRAQPADAEPGQRLRRRRPAQPGPPGWRSWSAGRSAGYTVEPKIDGMADRRGYVDGRLDAGRHPRRRPRR